MQRVPACIESRIHILVARQKTLRALFFGGGSIASKGLWTWNTPRVLEIGNLGLVVWDGGGIPGL